MTNEGLGARALALAEFGLIDEYEFVVQPRLAGNGPTLFAGLFEALRLELLSRLGFGSGAVAIWYEPRCSYSFHKAASRDLAVLNMVARTRGGCVRNGV
jgi:hypothetical protein